MNQIFSIYGEFAKEWEKTFANYTSRQKAVELSVD